MKEMEKMFENEPYEYEHIIGDEDVFLIRDGTQIHYKEVEKNE